MHTECKVTPGAQYRLNNEIYEVITATDLITLRSTTTKLHRHICTDDFSAMVVNGTIKKHQNAPFEMTATPLLLTVDERTKNVFTRKHEYIRLLDRLFDGSLPRKKTVAAIHSIANAIGDAKPPGYSTVYEWRKTYYENNRNPFALIKIDPNLPRGKIIAPEAREIMLHYINTEYLKPERPNIKTVYKLVSGAIKAMNLERSKYASNMVPLPSYSTFRREIMKINGYLVDSHRHSSGVVNKKYHFGIETEASESLYGKVQGDTALMNLFVIDDNGTVLGRPLLTALLDLGSRRCVGWDISLGSPNAEKVIKAIRMAVETKNGDCINGKMEELITDNGSEVVNQRIKLIARLLGFELRYVPPGQPNAKAHIERFFRTVDTGLTHFIPGTTKSSPEEREDYDSGKHACLTLKELKTYFERWVNGVYHETVHTALHMTPNQALTKMSSNELPPERFSKEDLDFICKCIERRKIRGGRVHMFELEWTGAGLPELARRLNGKKAIVYYDPLDLGTVWVAHPHEPRDMHPAVAVRPGYQCGLSLQDHKLVKERLAEEGKRFSDESAQHALIEIYNEISEIAKKRGKVKEPRKTSSTSSRSNARRKNAEQEKTASDALEEISTQNFETHDHVYQSFHIAPAIK